MSLYPRIVKSKANLELFRLGELWMPIQVSDPKLFVYNRNAILLFGPAHELQIQF